MYFRDVHFLGSMMDNLPEPDESFQNRGFLINEWHFNTDSTDSFIFQIKSKMNYDEMLDDWLTKFSDIFPAYIIGDARRIVYDLNVSNKYPSNVVLGAIIIACEFHNITFKDYFKDVCKMVAENRHSNKTVTQGHFFYRNLMHEAEDFKNQLGEDKISMLSKMWECLKDGISGW